MQLISRKSELNGAVLIPASKSHTIRAVAIASLAEGQSVIRNPLRSGDAEASVRCYRALGARIDTTDPAAWKVQGVGGQIVPPAETIDVGQIQFGYDQIILLFHYLFISSPAVVSCFHLIT